ncbi:hypothetical protein T05_10041, partial [Trichinella murrelli]
LLDSLFSLTPHTIAWHGIFQMLDRGRYRILNCSMVSFRSRRT